MSPKSRKSTGSIQRFEGQAVDARYLAFFECFNGHQFFKAHEVLEGLWLEERHKPEGQFYKGLIQLAGAFVHVQQGRLGPGRALLKLAWANLGRYRPYHQRLEVDGALETIGAWLRRLEPQGPAPMEIREESERVGLKLRDPGRR